jgi:hypothetical protein
LRLFRVVAAGFVLQIYLAIDQSCFRCAHVSIPCRLSWCPDIPLYQRVSIAAILQSCDEELPARNLS